MNSQFPSHQPSNRQVWTTVDLSFGEHQVRGWKLGNGPKLLVCFHGYLQTGRTFRHLFPHAVKDLTILAVDLPLFGGTDWPADHPTLHESYLLDLWKKIRGTFPAPDPIILGFSMGGRVALCLQQALHDPIRNAILVAPDGIKSNFFHRWVMHNPLGNVVVKWFCDHPAIILGMVDTAYRFRLIDKFLHRFLRGNFEHAHQRELLLGTLAVYSGPALSLRKLAKHTEGKVNWTIIWGRFDQSLSFRLADRFARLFTDTDVYILPAKHLVMEEKPGAVFEIISRKIGIQFDPKDR
ncbi:alpha/beta hydrolase [Pontibacter sp. G13]|uniref:alpha/beta fold hydrolase n=1 Tax=Pontibacter sp. G13 TaxID=3074898 RepID=UPI002889CDA1|nr:alpha/beta hydrolase [Pontibacter sp. G13]WNJ16272.1 alpha/beta hydrolase [Pontibacter sp. G13]